MPVRDRRSTAVRPSGGLSERCFVALARREIRTPPFTHVTPRPPPQRSPTPIARGSGAPVSDRHRGRRPRNPAPSRKPEKKKTTRRTRAQLSPRRSLGRGRHAAKGSPEVSPAARAMPVRDRRSTAVRPSGGLSERGFVALARRETPTPPFTHVTPRPPPRRSPTPNRARQRSAGLRPASRPQAAKPGPVAETRRRRRDLRAQLSPRHSPWRGRHAARGSPGVSPAARAMPVRDRHRGHRPRKPAPSREPERKTTKRRTRAVVAAPFPLATVPYGERKL